MPSAVVRGTSAHIFLGALVLAAVVVLGNRQLLQPVALDTRDHSDSYLRTHQYTRELADGHWPQTLPDAVQGGGSAFPRYYPPVSPWTAVALYAITGDVIAATHLSGLAAILLAALSCFIAFRILGVNPLPSTVASALYVLLPYPWVALNIRGAFAETWALAWYPLIAAGVVLSLRHRRPIWWLPPVVAGSVASHLLMTVWAVPILALVAMGSVGPDLRWSAVRRTAAAGAAGLGLGAVFLVPIVREVPALRAADPVLMHTTPEALVSVNWSFYESVFRPFPWWNHVEWALLTLGLVGLWHGWRDTVPTRRLCWAGLTAYAALAILARAPIEVWRLIPQSLRYIQFPERLLGIAGFCLALAFATVTSFLTTRAGKLVVAAVGLVVALYAARLGDQMLPRTEDTHAEILALLQTSYPNRGLTVVGEYLPRGTEPESLAVQVRRLRDRAGTPPLLSWVKDNGEYHARVMLKAPGEVMLPLVSYEFYDVTSGERSVETVTPAGLLTVRLGSGTHDLTIGRRMPPSSRAGLLISLLSVLGWTFWSLRRRSTTGSAHGQ